MRTLLVGLAVNQMRVLQAMLGSSVPVATLVLATNPTLVLETSGVAQFAGSFVPYSEALGTNLALDLEAVKRSGVAQFAESFDHCCEALLTTLALVLGTVEASGVARCAGSSDPYSEAPAAHAEYYKQA